MTRARMTPEQLERDRECKRARHHQRRALGRCAGAGCRRSPDLNPTTGLPFWRCGDCRAIQRTRDAAGRARRVVRPRMTVPAWQCTACGHRWSFRPAKKFLVFTMQLKALCCPRCGAGTHHQQMRSPEAA